jgi:hypothetical protein
VTVQWVTGFFDFPAAVFEAARDFWRGITGYALSPPRGPRADFVTLVPGTGDAYLRVQRIYDGPAGCHLDFHAPDWAGLAARAGGLGAQLVHAEEELAVFRSPGRLPFCVSAEAGGPARPQAARWPDGPVSLVDQFCLDIPADMYEDECRFWADLHHPTRSWHRAVACGAAAGRPGQGRVGPSQLSPSLPFTTNSNQGKSVEDSTWASGRVGSVDG